LRAETGDEMSKRTGFTLIELLVVIAVIALLLSILVPALRKVKKTAKVVVCKSNLRQLTMGVRLYAEANNGKAPAFGHNPGDYWFFDIAPYLDAETYIMDPEQERSGGMGTIYCPTSRRRPDDGNTYWGTAQWDWRWGSGVNGTSMAEGSYGMNLWLTPEFMVFQGDFPLEQHWPNYSSSRNDVPVFGDSNWVGAWPEDQDMTPAAGGGTLETGLRAHAHGYMMGRFCIDRHDMAINVSFVDGHVDKIRLGELWTLMWHKGFAPKTVVLP